MTASMNSVVTRGFGNGTFAGDIGLVVTMGYGISVPVVPPDRRRRIARFDESRSRVILSTDSRQMTAAITADERRSVIGSTDDRRLLPFSTDDRRRMTDEDVS